MNQEFSKQDEKTISLLSKIFNLSEEEIKKRYIPMSEESVKSISLKTIPVKKKRKTKETKQEKAKRKFNFLKEVMCTSLAISTETGTEIQYMISDEILREDLQYKVMSIVKEYLEADEK